MAASCFRFKLGAVIPDFDCETLDEKFTFHEFLSRVPAWTVLFSFGHHFAPVSTAELGQCQGILDQFKAMGTKIVGLTGGTAESNKAWVADALAAAGIKGGSLGFPLVSDRSGAIATKLGVIDADKQGPQGQPVVGNVVFVIGPNKTLRLGTMYPSNVGRSFLEVLRVVKSLLITQDFKLATPVNWKAGDRLIVTPGLTTPEAQDKYSNFEIKDLPSGKPYLRYVDCPDISGCFGQPDSSAAPGDSYEVAESDFKIQLGAQFPDFECSTSKGNFSFHDFLDRKTRWSKVTQTGRGEWTVFFSHPKDFTPVCTTELSVTQALCKHFATRNVKLIGLSCDTLDAHHEWEADVLKFGGLDGLGFDFPLISDEDRSIAYRLGMLDPLERDGSGPPMPGRTLFLIDPSRKIAFTIMYPATTGRNFEEVMRAVDAVMLARSQKVATPAEWKLGERVFLPEDMSDDEARRVFGEVEIKALPSGKGYFRLAVPVSSYAPTTIQDAWNNHFTAFGAKDVGKIMLDYDEDSVLVTFNDVYAGKKASQIEGYTEYKGVEPIKGFFTRLFSQLTGEDGNLVELAVPMNPIVEEDPGNVLLVWNTVGVKGDNALHHATDTFFWKKVGLRPFIHKQNIVITQPGKACSSSPARPLPQADDPVNKAWENHFSAFGTQDVDKILLDYIETSVIHVYDNTTQTYTKSAGLSEIRAMFTGLFAAIGPEGAGLGVKVLEVEPAFNSVFLVWKADSHPKATDSFLFNSDAKIVVQNIVVSSA